MKDRKHMFAVQFNATRCPTIYCFLSCIWNIFLLIPFSLLKADIKLKVW